MQIYQKISEFSAPLDISNKLSDNKSEMSVQEQSFLCGLIRTYRPEKLVEIGVSAGGTSAVILNCIQMLGLSTEMYSVDLSERYYLDAAKPTGYLIYEACEFGVDLKNHHLLCGGGIASRLEAIGSEIDFLVLDTTHTLPGEVLDFLTVLPFLKKDAVVVLHDLAIHFYTNDPAYATSVLFHSVVADKFLNDPTDYPQNIAAFCLTEDTKKYILDVFMALRMPWAIVPSKQEFEEYEKILHKFYPNECLELYYQAKSYNEHFVLGKAAPRTPGIELKEIPDVKQASHLLLYGTKMQGMRCLLYLKRNNIPVHGFVVSDGWEEENYIEGIPVYEYSKIPYKTEETFILLTNSRPEPQKILMGSKYHWIKVSGLL